MPDVQDIDEPLQPKATEPFCCHVRQMSGIRCQLTPQFVINYHHDDQSLSPADAELHSCATHLGDLVDATPDWAVERYGAWTHSTVWRLPDA